jgi:hypothetical protein
VAQVSKLAREDPDPYGERASKVCAFQVQAQLEGCDEASAADATRYLEVARSSLCACACLSRRAQRRVTGVSLALQESGWALSPALAAFFEDQRKVCMNVGGARHTERAHTVARIDIHTRT